MLTFLGTVLTLIAIALFVWTKLKSSYDKKDELIRERNESLRNIENHNIGRIKFEEPKNMPEPPIKWWYAGILGLLMLSLNGLFFWANPGTAYAVQYIWGGDEMIATQGLKLKYWGRTIPLSFEMSIKDVMLTDDDDELPESEDGIYNRKAVYWEFSDAIKAKISTAVIVGVTTTDEELFLNMADRNRSESKLIYGRVMPNIDAALKNTCKLMDAQEYISGKASDFDRYFKDQLENGMYLVEEYTENEQPPEVIGDTTTVRTINTNNNKQRKWRIKRDNQDNIVRDKSSNTLKQYGIQIYQAQVTGIDWEGSFDKRLNLQKEQVAQTQLEKQEAEKEYYRAKKEMAKAESEKVKERGRLEKEAIARTIEAQTQASVADQMVIAERSKVEVARLAAQSKKIAADAQAYENMKLVTAGLTPQELKDMEIQKNKDMWNSISKLTLPTYFMTGGGSSNGKNSETGMLEAILSAKLLEMNTTSKVKN